MLTVKAMGQQTAVIYNAYGEPEKVLETTQIACGEMGEGAVRIRLKAAVIHPSDFGMIGGSYGKLASLPAVAGREGVGEVVECGEAVEGLQVGDWVRMPPETGAWRDEVVAAAKGLLKLPNDLPLELAAMATINPPTAWRMLRDAHLNEGEWVIQNAANSAVGMHVIEMAKHLGLKTLNIVRRPELVEPLKAMGADCVALEDSGYEKKVKELTGGGRVQLALNSVGGESAIRLIKALSPGGRHVTFGGMSFETVRFPTRFLIFNQITMTGFWMDKWYRDNSMARASVMFEKVFDLMRRGIVKGQVAARYPLTDIHAAVAAAREPRLGKVLLLPSA